MTEQEFRLKADEALEAAERALLPLSDSEGFEIETQNGVLQIVFEEPAPASSFYHIVCALEVLLTAPVGDSGS